jgi:hypothetical protein
MTHISVCIDDSAELRALADKAQELVLYANRAADRMTDQKAKNAALSFAYALVDATEDELDSFLRSARDTLETEGPGYECRPDEADAELALLEQRRAEFDKRMDAVERDTTE